MTNTLEVKWIDRGREPQCPPDPAYPDGQDIDGALEFGIPTCFTELPYPAKRCGYYLVTCAICKCITMITTAGRPDDPRSVHVPCKLKGTKQ